MPLPLPVLSSAPSAPSKKDDEYRPRSAHDNPSFATLPAWLPSIPRVRKRRIIVVTVVAALVYLLVAHLPTDLQPVNERYDRRSPGRTYAGIPIPKFASATKRRKERAKPKDRPPGVQLRAPPRPKPGDRVEDEHYYDGDISFVFLAASLQDMARRIGYGSDDRSVVFVAASVESAARLIPLACEMGRQQRSLVHFAYMARDGISLADLRDVNGVKDGCGMFWHGNDYHGAEAVSTG